MAFFRQKDETPSLEDEVMEQLLSEEEGIEPIE